MVGLADKEEHMWRSVLVLLAASIVAGCAAPKPAAVGVVAAPLPSVRGPIPISAASYPFLASAHDTTPIDLNQSSYSEQEFFVSGSANVYSWPDLNTLTVDASGPYMTRILVRRPTDPARFSGNVRLEPLNPTSGHDLDAEWEIEHDGFMRAGDAYVGITVKPVSIEAMKRFDLARYSGLSMANPKPPGQRCTPYSSSSSQASEDGLAWDIISQVGRLIRSDVPENPLRDLHVATSDLTGWSQSGSYDIAYLNAIARHTTLPGGHPIFDAYLPGAGSYAGTPINQCASWIDPGDPRVQFNPPPGIPVMIVSTPTDFFSAASYSRRTARPDDSDTPERRIRLYEIGGGCHLPADHGDYFPALERPLPKTLTSPSSVPMRMSSFPLHVVLDAAFANLDAWVRGGVDPPHASRLTAQNPSSWPVRAVGDHYGNPLGGVRTPAVDVPTATYVERGLLGPDHQPSPYAGYDIPFSPQVLKTLYPTHQDYVDKVTADVRQLVAQRWLTDYDGAWLITQAQDADVPGI